MKWYYRFIKRRQYNLFIQIPTSVGQKLLDGWEDLSRSCVTEMLAMRRDLAIVLLYNQQHPHQVPIEILPISNICNFNESPQSVEPLHSSTLNVKGAGETVINTGNHGDYHAIFAHCAFVLTFLGRWQGEGKSYYSILQCIEWEQMPTNDNFESSISYVSFG
jgi:hypothetical protein